MMMQLEHLSRADMGSVLECRGSNNNHTQPVTASIRIDMNREYYSTTDYSTVKSNHFTQV